MNQEKSRNFKTHDPFFMEKLLSKWGPRAYIEGPALQEGGQMGLGWVKIEDNIVW